VVDLVTAYPFGARGDEYCAVYPDALGAVGCVERDQGARATLERCRQAHGAACRDSYADRAPEGAVQLLVRGEAVSLPLKGVIDTGGREARLDKEISKADADIKRVDAKLGNEKFVANAPEDIVEEERKSAKAAVARKAKIVEALERLKNAS